MPYNDRLFQLLAALDDSELRNIWVSALRRDGADEEFDAVSHELKVALISAEWRAAHGHSLRNLWRESHELPWKRILIDVADKLKPGVGWTDFRMDDSKTEPELERIVMGYFDERVGEQLCKEQASPKTSTPDLAPTTPDQGTLDRRAVRSVLAQLAAASLPGAPLARVAALLSPPAAGAVLAQTALSTAYRKTVPATLLLLTAHEMRRQLAELG
jgi:hypothetical protein